MGKVEVDTRVECEGAGGTVRWLGQVEGSRGLWYGVDWDDQQRGKHDGTHGGVKYFQTSHPKSGSFVRPGKVSTGITLETAVRGRYQDDTTIASQVTEQLQRTINARFVEVVGMEKVGAKQRQLDYLHTVILGGWGVWGTDKVNLTLLLPRLTDLDLSCSLLSSWSAVAHITCQLPNLRTLNLSGNSLRLPECSQELCESLKHITHLVLNNMLTYTWHHLLSCCTMFPTLIRFQVAFNDLRELGPIPPGQLECLEELDVGMNPLGAWTHLAYLGSLPRLVSLNANNCKVERVEFPDTNATDKSPLFPKLKNLTLANNPLSIWDCTGELDKLPSLEDLVISYDEKTSPYFQDFTLARIESLKVLNRSTLNQKEKRDCELFYLKSFSNEYYNGGGREDPAQACLSQEFTSKHPGYLRLVQALGAPMDETSYKTQKSQTLRDMKIELTIVTPNDPERESFVKSFLPSTKIAKLKMMLKRHLKINAATAMTLSFYSKDEKKFVIPLDNDMKELSYYSMRSGDTLLVHW